MSTKKLDPRIKLDLNGNPSPVTFSTVRQVEQWLEKEEKAWLELIPELRTHTGQYPHVSSACQIHAKQLEKLRSWVDSANDHKQSKIDSSPALGILQLYQNYSLIHSKSPVGRHIIDRFRNAQQKRDYIVTAALMCAAMRRPIPFHNITHSNNVDFSPLLEGYGLYTALTQPSVDETERDHAVIEATFEQWQDRFSDWNERLEDTEKRIQTDRDTLANVLTRFRKHSRSLRRISVGRIKESKKQLDSFEEYYREALRNEAPITYWNDKASAHKVSCIAFGITFGLLVLALAFATYSVGDFLLSSVPENHDNVFGYILTRLSVLLIPVFFTVWFLRIIAKLFLNNLRLYDDAKERAIMIQTFVSLLEHEEKMDPADRVLMLQSLFRPAMAHSDDDGAPPNWFDVLIQRIRSDK